MLRNIGINTFTGSGDATSGKRGGATGGFGTLDMLAVDSGAASGGAYSGTTTTVIPVLKYTFAGTEYQAAFTVTLPQTTGGRAVVSLDYDTDGSILMLVTSFADSTARLYRVTVKDAVGTPVLLREFTSAITSFSVLSKIQDTEQATNSLARLAAITLAGDATLYMLDINTGVIQSTPVILESDNVIDSTYYNDRLHYLTKEGYVYAKNLITYTNEQLFAKQFANAHSIWFRNRRLYINTATETYESQDTGVPRLANTFFIRAKVQPRIVFGERPDITFRSDEGYAGVLPAPTYFEPLTFEMRDLPTGMVLMPKLENLKPPATYNRVFIKLHTLRVLQAASCLIAMLYLAAPRNNGLA